MSNEKLFDNFTPQNNPFGNRKSVHAKILDILSRSYLQEKTGITTAAIIKLAPAGKNIANARVYISNLRNYLRNSGYTIRTEKNRNPEKEIHSLVFRKSGAESRINKPIRKRGLLKELRLENFKAFSRTGPIPLAPITLIYGQNSAGKSSILNSIYLIKQTLKFGRGQQFLVPRTENGYVDLGNYRDFVRDHKVSNRVSIGFDFWVPPMFDSLKEIQSCGLDYTFERKTDGKDILPYQLKLRLDDKTVARYRREGNPRSDSAKSQSSIYASGEPDIFASRSCRMVCEKTVFVREYWERYFDKIREFLETGDKNQKDRRIQELASELRHFQIYEDFIEWQEANESSSHLKLTGFESMVDTHRSMNSKAIFGPTVSWLSSNSRRFFINSFSLGPYRKPAERIYMYAGNSPDDVGYSGENLQDFIYSNQAGVEDINFWLERLEVGYQIDLKPLLKERNDLFELRLTDTRRRTKIDVGLPDVGFGVSQILPLIVQALSSDRKLITVEQPEIHIHPKLQAEFGTLIAESAKGVDNRRGNQFIIETHSEHLVLRLRKLIREGMLLSEDVSVLYVSREEEGSVIDQIGIDEKGNFIDEWPHGFFPERLNELS